MLSQDYIIRQECPADYDAIHDLTRRAFQGRPYAGGDEQDVIDRLRATDALTLSMVAEDQGGLSGQITFSPAINSDGSQPWFALGPGSVTPERQNQGIGGELIRQGLARIRALGALGCILTGNPEYYRRFGFALAADLVPEAESAEYFMLYLFAETRPTGQFQFHKAFYGKP